MNKCDSCKMVKTDVTGHKYCSGSTCEVDIRTAVLEEVESAMYHQCFECDNNETMQRWDSGNWFRYKLFENVMNKLKLDK